MGDEVLQTNRIACDRLPHIYPVVKANSGFKALSKPMDLNRFMHESGFERQGNKLLLGENCLRHKMSKYAKNV